MADYREDVGIYPVMVELAACAEQSLERSGLAPAEFVTIQPGLLGVQDYIGNGKNCSELIITMTQAYPVDPFPSPAQGGTCATDLAYEVSLALFRCAAPMNGTKPPTPAQQLGSTRDHLADMAAMHRAILCCMKNQSRSYALRAFVPYGPNGTVVGGVWNVVVGQEI